MAELAEVLLCLVTKSKLAVDTDWLSCWVPSTTLILYGTNNTVNVQTKLVSGGEGQKSDLLVLERLRFSKKELYKKETTGQ